MTVTKNLSRSLRRFLQASLMRYTRPLYGIALEKLPITISKPWNCMAAAYANATHDPVQIDANIERFQERVVDHIFSMKVSDGMQIQHVNASDAVS